MTKKTITCNNCQVRLRVAEDFNKSEVKCPKCEAVIVVVPELESPIEPPMPIVKPDIPAHQMVDNPYGNPRPTSQAPPGQVPIVPQAKYVQATDREMVIFDKKKTVMGDRYYLTLWFEEAKGFSEQYLNEVRSCIIQSRFPEVHIKPATATNHNAGCLAFLFPTFKFDAIAFWSKRDDLEHFRCLYKAKEFGNVLHISLMFYTQVDLGCNQMLSNLFKFAQAGDDLEKAEYEEAFSRFVWMVLLEAADRLGSTPIKKQVDERQKKQSALKNAFNWAGR